MHKAFKFEMCPTSEQASALNRCFGSVRYVYNWALSERKKAYEESGQRLSGVDQMKIITQLKKQPDTVWLAATPSQPLQQAVRHLDAAFQNFFKKKARFPRFKSKRDRQSFSLPQGVKLNGSLIFLPKIGWVKYFKSREVLGPIKTVTVSRTPTGRYYVSVLADVPVKPAAKRPVSMETAVGIDVGIKSLLVTSDGEEFENQKFLRKSLRCLAVEQKKLARRKKGGKRREAQRLRVARLHERVVAQRRDLLHQLSTYLVRRCDTIVLEDLHVSGMMKNRKLSLAIAEVGWYNFRLMLEYKCEWYGKNFAVVPRFYPSSKTCNHCKAKLDRLPLQVREWQCPSCGAVNDRDHNAAKNIKEQGVALLLDPTAGDTAGRVKSARAA